MWSGGDDLPEEVKESLLEYEKKSRYLIKRSEDQQVIEDVFDKATKMALYKLINKGALQTLIGVVKTGKESRVYWGKKADNTDVAVKIYLTVAADFRRRLPYIQGDPRFTNVGKGIRNIVEVWAKKEYRNLSEAYKAGVKVPQPFNLNKNILVMQFIGEEGKPAPTLKEVDKLTQKDYRNVIEQITLLYQKAELVHSDLSEYNIFKWRDEVILFDFGSAVSREHPNADDFLQRDIENLNRFFSKKGVRTQQTQTLLKKVKGE
ncbi:MAG: serine protein kinase RIO [Nitrososphaerales archaeon]